MGLLAKLQLSPPRNNPAHKRAVRRARLAAQLSRSQDRREVLDAAIDMAANSRSNGELSLGLNVVDPANPQTPIASMAPRDAYQDLPEGAGEDRYLAGRIHLERKVVPQESFDPRTGRFKRTTFDVKTKVHGRGLVPARLGEGERVYDKGEAGALRKPAGFRAPEPLVMEHEHLHLVIAAHISRRIEEFADEAFRDVRLDPETAGRLVELLGDIADEAEDRVDEWLDQTTIPDAPEEIDDAKALTQRLLEDGTLESRARTELLKSLRRHSRALARLRQR